MVGEAARARGAEYFNPDEVARRIRAAAPGLSDIEVNAAAWNEGRRLLEKAIAIDGNFDVYGNGDFFMNSIDWAAQQENLLNLTTRPRTERIFTAPQSAWQFLLLVLIIVVIIPGMIVFFGISTWISRRRRG